MLLCDQITTLGSSFLLKYMHLFLCFSVNPSRFHHMLNSLALFIMSPKLKMLGKDAMCK